MTSVLRSASLLLVPGSEELATQLSVRGEVANLFEWMRNESVRMKRGT